MRIVRASLQDAYKVHKTICEFTTDVGGDLSQIQNNYDVWLKRLTDQERIYLLLLHGKKCVGMVWGEALKNEPKRTILIEGRYLRRAYRGKIRFARALYKAVQDVVHDFEVIRMIVPANKKVPAKYKVLGTLVEV